MILLTALPVLRGRGSVRARKTASVRRGLILWGGVLTSISPEAGELLQGEDRFHRHVEVPGDAQGQVEGWGVLPALQVAHRLIMDAQRL